MSLLTFLKTGLIFRTTDDAGHKVKTPFTRRKP